MSATLSSPSTSFAGVSQRTEDNRRSFAELQIPEDAITTVQAMDWFNAVKQFRDVESKYLSQAGVFDLTLDEHRESVSNLIAIGEQIVLDVKSTGLVKAVSFTLGDIKATIESLRETFKGVHGPHNHSETNKAIFACLDEK